MKTVIDNFKDIYHFLSNSSKSEIFLGDRLYRSVEHFYQAGKANTFEDHEYIRTAATPEEARKRAKEINKREDWEDIKDKYMTLGLMLKFDITDLGDMLLATGDSYIQAENDPYWGVCDGIGENKLGLILMEVRDQVLDRRSKQITQIGSQNVH